MTVASSPPSSVTERASRVQLMIFDVDGVLTDGRLYFNAAGETIKSFHALDGQGIKLLRQAGIPSALITSRSSEIVATRARDLGIEFVYQGVAAKNQAFVELLLRTGLSAEQCGYMGDDWPDLPVMLQVAFAAAPPNAQTEVIARAHWVTQASGGGGAVREICDLILRAQHRYDALAAIYQNLPLNCLKGRQPGDTGAEHPEWSLVHEDCEHRPGCDKNTNHGLLDNLGTGSKTGHTPHDL